MPIIIINAGTVGRDRAQNFSLKIYDPISTIHLRTSQNCQRMDEFTLSLIYSTDEQMVSEHSVSLDVGYWGLMAPRCLRCWGSRESSTQQSAAHCCAVDNDQAKGTMQIISVKRHSLSHLPDECFSSSSFLSSVDKAFTCNAGDTGLSPGSGRSPGEGKGYQLQYSGLENSMDCIVHGVTKSQTRLSDFHFHFPGRCALMTWKRERVHVSLPPWGRSVDGVRKEHRPCT